jgi:hypothetical protein
MPDMLPPRTDQTDEGVDDLTYWLRPLSARVLPLSAQRTDAGEKISPEEALVRHQRVQSAGANGGKGRRPCGGLF